MGWPIQRQVWRPMRWRNGLLIAPLSLIMALGVSPAWAVGETDGKTDGETDGVAVRAAPLPPPPGFALTLGALSGHVAANLQVPSATATATATPWSLPALEDAARQQALSVQTAQADVAIEQHRLEGADALSGARLSASAGVATTREPVTDDVVRDYDRAGVQVGVRWPWLSAQEQAERNRVAATGDLGTARLRLTQAQGEAVLQLRLAYVDAWRSAERLRLAQRFLQLEAASAGMLAGRTRDGLLLNADRMAFQSAFDTARRDAVREEVARGQALDRLRQLSGHSLPDAFGSGQAPAPRWDGGPCLAQVDPHTRPTHVDTDAARVQLDTAQAVAAHQRWVGVDAGLSLTQSLTRDLGSASGRSTGVSVDVSLPFEWRRLRDVAQAESQARVRRAELALQAAQQREDNLARAVHDEWRVRESDRQTYAQRLAVAWEALRVAQLRASRLDGDVLEKRLQALYALYGAAVEASQSLQRLERAQAQMLALWPACEGSGVRPVSAALLDEVPARLGQFADQGGEGGEADSVTPTGVAAGSVRWAWFIWQAAPWLAAPPAMLAKLPLGSSQLLVSLTAAELRDAATPAGHAALAALLAQAHARGCLVMLLMGDPDWVRHGGGTQLLGLLRPLRDLPLDGLVLDLERSQLRPRMAASAWRKGTVQLMGEVAQAIDWPLGLVTHDRDLGHRRFLRELTEVGVTTLYPMIYVSRAERIAPRLRTVLDALPSDGRAPAVLLAQSVEPALAPAESWHAPDRPAALAALRTLRARLATVDTRRRLDAAIAIQSFEAFQSLAP